MILGAVVIHTAVPSIAARVHEVQSAAGVLDADARAAAVLLVLGVVGVRAAKGDSVVVGGQADVDHGVAATADTVLKGILNERDEE